MPTWPTFSASEVAATTWADMKAVEFWMDGMEKVARALSRVALHCGSGSRFEGTFWSGLDAVGEEVVDIAGRGKGGGVDG